MSLTEQQLRKAIRKMVKENLANFGDKKETFGKDKEDKPTKSSKDFSSEKEDDIEECADKEELKESSDLQEGVSDRFDLLNDFQGKSSLTDEDMLDELVRQIGDQEAREAFAYIASTHDLSSTLKYDIEDRKTNRFEMLERVLEEFGEDHSMLLDAVVRQMSDQGAREAFEYLSRMHDVPMEEAYGDNKPVGKQMQSMQSPVAQPERKSAVGSKFQKNLPRVRPPAKQTMRIEENDDFSYEDAEEAFQDAVYKFDRGDDDPTLQQSANNALDVIRNTEPSMLSGYLSQYNMRWGGEPVIEENEPEEINAEFFKEEPEIEETQINEEQEEINEQRIVPFWLCS